MNRSVLAGTFLTMLALSTLAATSTRADDWSKTYQISARADLRVSTDDGDVTIIGSDQKQIDAHVTTEGYKISSSEVRIEESQSGDHVVISVKVPHFNFSFFGGRHKSIKVELHVPRELELDVETSDGNVTATGVHGDIRLHTGDGHITGTNFDASSLILFSSTGITVSNQVVSSSTTITATFNIAGGAPLGTQNVTVMTTAGTTPTSQPFTVDAAPTMTSEPGSPASGSSWPAGPQRVSRRSP